LTKHGTTKRTKGNPLKRGFPWYLWAGIAVVICVVAVVILAANPFLPRSTVQTDGLKCAIVDQLYEAAPNPVFIQHITQLLESSGFSVDVYRTDEVTVDFYEQLPSHGYKLIIFRVHAGLLENETGRGDKIWFFTSEKYSRMRYYIAQLRDQITAAKTTIDDTPVFAVSAKFVTQCMRHDFSDTVIINMGCASFYSDELARAFVERGASAYMGWDASVGLNYVDAATMVLIEKLFSEELTIEQTVNETMKEKGPDPNNNAYLKYFTESGDDKTIDELIQ
jgi:hypothetical protein